MARNLTYYADQDGDRPRENYASPRVYTSSGGGFRQRISQRMREEWDSPEGWATREALARAVPRREMSAAVRPLAAELHRRLAPLGPQISASYRQVWGTA